MRSTSSRPRQERSLPRSASGLVARSGGQSRNEELNAIDFFSAKTGTKPPSICQWFGGSIGGPVKKRGTECDRLLLGQDRNEASLQSPVVWWLDRGASQEGQGLRLLRLRAAARAHEHP